LARELFGLKPLCQLVVSIRFDKLLKPVYRKAELPPSLAAGNAPTRKRHCGYKCNYMWWGFRTVLWIILFVLALTAVFLVDRRSAKTRGKDGQAK
jgi:hypothetical protein